MPELVLPGVYITERPEALIVPGPVTVGNIGIVGTARRGEVGKVHLLSSLDDAKQAFGNYDPFDAPDTANAPLSLVRALELAYNNGASTVLAVRVTETDAAGDTTAGQAKFTVVNPAAAGGTAAVLNARGPGLWGNKIQIKIEAATPPPADSVRVTLTYLKVEEVYTVTDGKALVGRVMAAGGSTLVTAELGDKPNVKPDLVPATAFGGGSDANDAKDTDYALGLDRLLNANAHIMLAAGRHGAAIDGLLEAHVQAASADKGRRERMALTGSAPGASVSDIDVSSDRVVFVQPGIQVAAAGGSVTLPGSYAAAAIAGMLSARDPQVSLTNKTLAGIAGLEQTYNSAQLEQLVTARVLALEVRQGERVVKGISTDDGAFRQITTRRIVDFARIGVRSAADPYIGLLNNDRVRKALKGSINGFLAGMVSDEMLESYELDVTATREEEIRGIARVTMTVRPVFSIDYIQVVMFLG